MISLVVKQPNVLKRFLKKTLSRSLQNPPSLVSVFISRVSLWN